MRSRKSDNKRSFVNSILTSVVCTQISVNKYSLNFKQYTDIIPRTSRLRLFNEVTSQRSE